MHTMTPRKLTLTDIADVRAYEREREEFRAHVIALKRRRRVHVGLFVTFLFENYSNAQPERHQHGVLSQHPQPRAVG